MGGRIIFERMSCKNPKSPSDETFVRININDGIVAVPNCHDGPGHSCSLAKFLSMVASNAEKAGDFSSRCGLSQDAPKSISFLHQDLGE
jgi:acid phosphatase